MGMLSELSVNGGAKHYRKRVGRGHSTGTGGTAGKGHKGQKARAGGRVRWGFEGGQTPLVRRLPKFGFSNRAFATKVDVISLKALLDSGLETVDVDALVKAKLISGDGAVKVIGSAAVSKPIVIKGISTSLGAKRIIEAAGGRVEGK